MKVAVIGGTGYVGLVTGIGLAAHQNDVICVDIDRRKVNEMNNNILPIHEEGLSNLLKEAKKNNKIRFTSRIKDAVAESTIIIVAVGTLENKNGDADMSYLFKALKTIADSINEYKVIVIKSTVPVGTCEMAELFIRDNLRNHLCTFDVTSNPEFLKEGSAVKDFMFPERIVIGANSEKAAKLLTELYTTFDAPVLLTDVRSSELIKYACNCYLATRISFINEIAEICERTNADINSVIAGMKLDKRIGGAYLSPGPGFGGPCLSKDIKSLINFAARADANVGLLKSVLYRNELQITNIFSKICSEVPGSINKKVSVLGLSFKAGTNDTRNSPALSLIKILAGTKNKVEVYDPVVKGLEIRLPSNISIAGSLDSAVEESDCLIIMTEWDEFKSMDLVSVYNKMRTPVIIDTRNILQDRTAKEIGFRYIGIGIQSLSYESREEELKCII